MFYREFHGLRLSNLGFGTMRLPMKADQTIDEAQVEKMVDYAMTHGVNYFDTAYPYHGGESEVVIGRTLRKYPRDSYYLATKYPGHQIASHYDPAAVFEEQLQKCGVEYFDFYLLHNVYENSIKTYLDPRWGIVDYFIEQKRKGRIRYLGFSTHGSTQTVCEFLDHYDGELDFCQIQLNYLDWTLQDAKGKYEMLTKRGIPIWVMEPVRGGKLAKLTQEQEARLKAMRPDASVPSWAFRFLQRLPNVTVVLSGMSNLTQMEDNVRTFTEERPLSVMEADLLMGLAEELKNSVPCTACRYCCDGCPQQLDIPTLLGYYNEVRYLANTNVGMRVEALGEEKQPSACIGCGACSAICPQRIDIPGAMQDFSQRLSKIPSWADICRQRDEAAQKQRER